MVKISIEYTGDLHCSALHEPSKTTLATDAPLDNKGRGESFSPTDLTATSLGTCMATTMGIIAQKHGIDLQDVKIEVAKIMTQEGPRRIAKLATEIWMPALPSSEKREALKKAALTCPVYLSLNPEIEKPVIFHWAND